LTPRLRGAEGQGRFQIEPVLEHQIDLCTGVDEVLLITGADHQRLREQRGIEMAEAVAADAGMGNPQRRQIVFEHDFDKALRCNAVDRHTREAKHLAILLRRFVFEILITEAAEIIFAEGKVVSALKMSGGD